MLRNYLGFEMKITERDIFNFVFFRDNLSVEKVNYLKNSKNFIEEIDFYLSLKQSFDEELSEDVKQKIAEKISIYIPSKIFFLFPVEQHSKKRTNSKSVLAAATSDAPSEVHVKTFVDETNRYLIRLLNFKDSAKIYVFSTTDEVLKNYRIIIKPSEQTFEQNDNSSPIEIDWPIEAENIELQFN